MYGLGLNSFNWHCVVKKSLTQTVREFCCYAVYFITYFKLFVESIQSRTTTTTCR